MRSIQLTVTDNNFNRHQTPNVNFFTCFNFQLTVPDDNFNRRRTPDVEFFTRVQIQLTMANHSLTVAEHQMSNFSHVFNFELFFQQEFKPR